MQNTLAAGPLVAKGIKRLKEQTTNIIIIIIIIIIIEAP
jgi:hypothetical protein